MFPRDDKEYKKFEIGDYVICDHVTSTIAGELGKTATVVRKYKFAEDGHAYYIEFEDGRQVARYSWSFSLAGTKYDPNQQPYDDGDI